MRKAVCVVVIMAALMASASQADLLVNGDFETGDFTGWSVNTEPGTNGLMSIATPGTTTPVSGQPTVLGAGQGNWYAVTDQGGPGTYSLTQTFTVPGPVPQVILSFDLFVNNWHTTDIVDLSRLDAVSGGPLQYARVDILANGSGPFETGAGVLATYYAGSDGISGPYAPTPYSIDITGIVGGGGTFILRFAEADNQMIFNMGVDNAGIVTVPEPGTFALLGLGAVGFALYRRRKQA